jgi:apolipoprotein N-acyltransferase
VSQPIRQAVLMAVISAALQVLIFPSFAHEWLAWIALAPIIYILVLRELTLKNSFLVAYLCGVLWYAGTCFWIYHTMHLYGGLPKSVSVGIVVLFCLYLGIYHGLFGWLLAWVAERQSTRAALMVAPALWVAVELARYHITGFPWDLLGNAVVDNLGITPLARWTGVYGLSFVVAAVNAMFAWALYRRTVMDLVIAVVFAGALQAASLRHPPEFQPKHSALLVQQNVPINPPGTWTPDYFDRMMAELTNLSRLSGAQGSEPQLIVWPESPSPFYVTDMKFRSWMSALAADQKSYLIAGSLGVGNSEQEIYNSAVLIGPDGRFGDRYDKRRLVPFGEYVPYKYLLFFADKLTREVSEFSRGEAAKVMDLGKGKAGVFICYESIFPSQVRDFALNGASLFINISNDGWYGPHGAPGQHMNMARMRAIENDRWILRATNTGITTSIDPRGRVVAEAPRDVRVALNAPYDFVEHLTFYTRHGDWFAWTCAIIAIISFIAPRRRANS